MRRRDFKAKIEGAPADLLVKEMERRFGYKDKKRKPGRAPNWFRAMHHGVKKARAKQRLRQAYHDLSRLGLDFRFYNVRMRVPESRMKRRNRSRGIEVRIPALTVMLVRKVIKADAPWQTDYYRSVAVCHPNDQPELVFGRAGAALRMMRLLKRGGDQTAWLSVEGFEVICNTLLVPPGPLGKKDVARTADSQTELYHFIKPSELTPSERQKEKHPDMTICCLGAKTGLFDHEKVLFVERPKKEPKEEVAE